MAVAVAVAVEEGRLSAVPSRAVSPALGLASSSSSSSFSDKPPAPAAPPLSPLSLSAPLGKQAFPGGEGGDGLVEEDAGNLTSGGGVVGGAVPTTTATTTTTTTTATTTTTTTIRRTGTAPHEGYGYGDGPPPLSATRLEWYGMELRLESNLNLSHYKGGNGDGGGGGGGGGRKRGGGGMVAAYDLTDLELEVLVDLLRTKSVLPYPTQAQSPTPLHPRNPCTLKNSTP